MRRHLRHRTRCTDELNELDETNTSAELANLIGVMASGKGECKSQRALLESLFARALAPYYDSFPP